MTRNCGDQTFMKITNADIYKKLCDIESHVQETNGKVKMNKLISYTALILALTCISILTGIQLSGTGLL